MCAVTPTDSADRIKALLSRGKQGPPYPNPNLKYLLPILSSEPIAFNILSGFAPILIATSPMVLAIDIFAVSEQLRPTLVNSALVLSMKWRSYVGTHILSYISANILPGVLLSSFFVQSFSSPIIMILGFS